MSELQVVQNHYIMTSKRQQNLQIYRFAKVEYALVSSQVKLFGHGSLFGTLFFL